MPNDAVHHDIALLELAIASASEMLAPGLLDRVEEADLRAEIANLQSTIADLSRLHSVH